MATGGESSIPEQQNFTRIQIALADLGIALLKELFLQRVCTLSPPDRENGPWEVDEFLHQNMTVILQSVGRDRHKKNVLYPGFMQNTKVDKWDIPLFVLVLLSSCDISNADSFLRHDITNLGSIRNKLCHQPDYRLSEGIYSAYIGSLRGSTNRICEFLNNQTLKQFVNKTLDEYECLKLLNPNDMVEEYVNPIETVSVDDQTVHRALEQIRQVINDTGIQIEIEEIDVQLLSLREMFTNAIGRRTLQESDSQERDEQGDTNGRVDDEVIHI